MKLFVILLIVVSVCAAGPVKRKQPEPDAFAAYDINGDGSITAEEIADTLGGLGIQADVDKSRQALANIDANGDGVVDNDEFNTVYQALHNADQLEEPIAFSAYDQDADGFVTFDELKKLITVDMKYTASDMELSLLITNSDTDGDGVVSEAEFDAIYNTIADER